LDVGGSWSNPVRANARGDQNCLRSRTPSGGLWTFPGRLRDKVTRATCSHSRDEHHLFRDWLGVESSRGPRRFA
jgi:hypothetical protein